MRMKNRMANAFSTVSVKHSKPTAAVKQNPETSTNAEMKTDPAKMQTMQAAGDIKPETAGKSAGSDVLTARPAFDPITGKEMVFRAIPVTKIKILKQVRHNVDEQEEAFQDLVNDIRNNGLHQPITVVTSGMSGYYLLMGERRLRAFLQLNKEEPQKWTHIPAHVRPPIPGSDFTNVDNWTDDAALKWITQQLSENTMRENLSALDNAYAVQTIAKRAGTVKAAKLLGRSPAWVSQRITAVESMTEEIRQYAEETKMRDTHLLYSLVLANKKHPEAVAEMIRNDTVSIAKLRELDKEPEAAAQEEEKADKVKKPKLAYSVAFTDSEGREQVGFLDLSNKKLRSDNGEVCVRIEGRKKKFILKASEVRLLGATELPED